MQKYLIKNTVEIRVNNKADADTLHKKFEEAAYDGDYTLTSWTETYKEVKAKGEVVDEFYLCKAVCVFNDAKNPYNSYTGVDFVTENTNDTVPF